MNNALNQGTKTFLAVQGLREKQKAAADKIEREAGTNETILEALTAAVGRPAEFVTTPAIDAPGPARALEATGPGGQVAAQAPITTQVRPAQQGLLEEAIRVLGTNPDTAKFGLDLQARRLSQQPKTVTRTVGVGGGQVQDVIFGADGKRIRALGQPRPQFAPNAGAFTDIESAGTDKNNNPLIVDVRRRADGTEISRSKPRLQFKPDAAKSGNVFVGSGGNLKPGVTGRIAKAASKFFGTIVRADGSPGLMNPDDAPLLSNVIRQTEISLLGGRFKSIEDATNEAALNVFTGGPQNRKILEQAVESERDNGVPREVIDKILSENGIDPKAFDAYKRFQNIPIGQ